MPDIDEEVLSLPSAKLYEAAGKWQGLRKDTPELWRALAQSSSFRPRSLLESDLSMKQLVSYTLFVAARRIFVMKRLSSQSESRLHGLLSVGVGGHMNPDESIPWPSRRRVSDLKRLVLANTEREIKEEVSMAGNLPPSIVGFLNDDSNQVGQVHLGIVSVVALPSPLLAVRETDKMMGAWIDISELDGMGKFESWSALVLKGIK